MMKSELTYNTPEIKTSLISKYFCLIIYFSTVAVYLYILFAGSRYGLFGMPVKGMDQYTMLITAANLYKGQLPGSVYFYSYSYTLFLYLLITITHGNILYMKIIQACVCALTPVFVYKVAKEAGLEDGVAELSGLIYCLYGATAVVTLSFLRASPLALCFILYIYFIIKSLKSGKIYLYIVSGFFSILCVLGRENFIPIAGLPIFFLFIKEYRNREFVRNLLIYFLALIIFWSPAVAFNYIHYNSIIFVPGKFDNILHAYYGDAGKADYYNIFLLLIHKIYPQILKFVSSYEIPNSLSFYAHRAIIDFIYVLFIPFNFLVASAIVGAFCNLKNKYVLFISLSGIVYIFSMLYFDMYYRFRIPLVPVLSILTAVALVGIFRRKGWFYKIVFIVLFTYFTYINPEKLRPENERLAVINVLINHNDLCKAEILLKKENKLSPEVQSLWCKYYQRQY